MSNDNKTDAVGYLLTNISSIFTDFLKLKRNLPGPFKSQIEFMDKIEGIEACSFANAENDPLLEKCNNAFHGVIKTSGLWNTIDLFIRNLRMIDI